MVQLKKLIWFKKKHYLATKNMQLPKQILLIILCLYYCIPSNAQTNLNDYLPQNTTYNSNIPTPQSILGHEVGEWHVSHDKLVQYMETMAKSSDKATIETYAHSYENRPLQIMTITSESNQKKIKELQKNHLKLSDPNGGKVDIDKMPAVVYLGYSVHGNESSGSNAAMLIAYHLLAGESKEIKEILENTIILLDACMNPDGFHRFSTWVNVHKSKNLNPDPQNREYNEVWPGGRTNHYWFDLNRDWLLVQHPESQGRIKKFHEWKPNVLTDAHEMGTNSTYFFQPGIPSRNNPLTPENTFTLTGELAKYHAAALDSIGSLYYSQESFDDFYIGKGSTYPDVNGCVGILFEQASSRGHLQESVNGLVSFPFTIRNQFNTSLSTLKGTVALRKDLLKHQREFYQSAIKEAKDDKVKGYIFGDNDDVSKTKAFAELLAYHNIEAKALQDDYKGENHNFEAGKAYIIENNQPQYRLIKGMFETRTSFTDSLFYDVSAWTLPFSFNIPYEPLKKVNTNIFKGKKKKDNENKAWQAEKNPYAYLIKNDDYYIHALLNDLLSEDVIVKVATKTFEYAGKNKNVEFNYGTVMIPVGSQKDKGEQIKTILEKYDNAHNGSIYAMPTGLTESGVDLGSPSFSKLQLPKVGLIVGEGINAYEAGEVWHLLDQRYNMYVSLLDKSDIKNMDIGRYNVLVLVNGNYAGLNSATLKGWLKSGGVLITSKGASKWVATADFCKLSLKEPKKNAEGHFAYNEMDNREGAQVIGGAIFEGQADLTHPLLYGINRSKIPLFRNHRYFFKPTKNAYATPIRYTENPLLSGYISKKNLDYIKGSAALMVSGQAKGRIIAFADNPNFRAFWYGTNKLFMNAIFFGHIIESGARE